MCQVFPLHRARGYTVKCWLSPSVYRSLEWSQCVFHSTALDTVISMQVVVDSHSLKYERKWGSVQGRERRQETGVTWFPPRHTPGTIYWAWEPEVWVSSKYAAGWSIWSICIETLTMFLCVPVHAAPLITPPSAYYSVPVLQSQPLIFCELNKILCCSFVACFARLCFIMQ